MNHADMIKNTQKWKQYSNTLILPQLSYDKIYEQFDQKIAEQTVKTWKGITLQNAKLGDIEIVKKGTGWFSSNPFQKIKSFVPGLESKATYFCGIKPLATKQFYRGCCYYENSKQKVYQIIGQEMIAMMFLQHTVIDFRFYSKTKKGVRQLRFHVRMDGKSSGFVQWGDKPAQKLQRKFTTSQNQRKAYYSISGQKTDHLAPQKSDRIIYHYLGKQVADGLSILQYFWIVTGVAPFFSPFTYKNYLQFNHNSDRKHLQIRFRSGTLLQSMFHQMYPNEPRCSPFYTAEKKFDIISFQVFKKNQQNRKKITQQQTIQRKNRYLTQSREQKQLQVLKQQIQRFKVLREQIATKQTIRFQKETLQAMGKRLQDAFKKKSFSQAMQAVSVIKQYKQTQKIPQQYINLTKKTFNLQKQGVITQGMALYQPNAANQTFTMKDYTMNNSFINQTFGDARNNINQTFGMKDMTIIDNNQMNQTFILKDLQRSDLNQSYAMRDYSKANISMNQSFAMHDYSRANISMNQSYLQHISKKNNLDESKINNKWSLQKLYNQNKISLDLKQKMTQNRNLKFVQDQKQLQEKKKLLKQQNIPQNLNQFPSMKQDLHQDDFSNPFITFFSTLGINQTKGIHFHFIQKMSQTMIRIAMRYFLYIGSYNSNITYAPNDFPTILNDITANFLIINIQIDFILYPSIDHYLAIVYFFNRFQKLDSQIPELMTVDIYQYYNKNSHLIQFDVSSEGQQPSKQKIQTPQHIALKSQMVSLIKKIDDNFTILQNCFFACSLRNRVNFNQSDIQNVCMQIMKNCYMFFVSSAQLQQQISLIKRNKMLEVKKNRLLSIIQLINVKILLLITFGLSALMFFQVRKDQRQISIKRIRQKNNDILHRLSQYVANLLLIARITSFDAKTLSVFIYQEQNCILREIDYISVNKRYNQFEIFMKDSKDARISQIFYKGFRNRSSSIREIMRRLKKHGKKHIKLLQYIQKNLGRIKQKNDKAIDKALNKLQPKIKRHITNIIKPNLDSQIVQHIADILNEVNLNFSIDRQKNLLGLTLSCKSINYTNKFQLYNGNEKLNDFIYLCGRNLGIVLTNEENTQKYVLFVNDLTRQSQQRFQKNKFQFLERQKIKLNLLGFVQQDFQLTQNKQMQTIQELFKKYSSHLLQQIQVARTQNNTEAYLVNQANYIAFQQNQVIIKKVLVGVLTKNQFMQGTIWPQIQQISKAKLNEINLLDESKFEIMKKQFGQQGTFYSVQKWMQDMLNYNLQISLIPWVQIKDKIDKVMDIYVQLIRDVNDYMNNTKYDQQMQNRKIILRGICSFFISMIDKINQDKGQLFEFFFTKPFQKATQFQTSSQWIQNIFAAISQQYKESNYERQLTVKAISKQLNKKLQHHFQQIQQTQSQRYEKYQQAMRNVVANLERNAELLVNKVLKMEQVQRNLVQEHNKYSNMAHFKDRDQLQFKRQLLRSICQTLQITGDNLAQIKDSVLTRVSELQFSSSVKQKLALILKDIGHDYNQQWQQNLNDYIKIRKSVQIALNQQIAYMQQQIRLGSMVDQSKLVQAKFRIQNLQVECNQLQNEYNKLTLSNQVITQQRNILLQQNGQFKSSQKKHQQQVNRINQENVKKFAALGAELNGKRQQLKQQIATLDFVNKDLTKTKKSVEILQQQIKNYQQMRQQFIKSTNAYQQWIERLSNQDNGLQEVLHALDLSQIPKVEKSIQDDIQQSQSVIQQMNNILQKMLEKNKKYNKITQQYTTYKTTKEKQIDKHLQKISELEKKMKELNNQQNQIKKQKANKQIDIKTKQLLTQKQEQAKKLAAEKQATVLQLEKKAVQLAKITQQKNKTIQQLRQNLAKGISDQTTKKATQQYLEKKTKQYTEIIKNFQAKQKKKIQELLAKKTIESLFQAFKNIQQYLQVQKISRYQSTNKRNMDQMKIQEMGFKQLLDTLSFNVAKAQQNLDRKKKSLQQNITSQLPNDIKKKVVQQFQRRVNQQQIQINQIIKDLKSEIQERGKAKVGQFKNNEVQMKQIRDRIKTMTQNIYQVDSKFIQAAKTSLQLAKKKVVDSQRQNQDIKKLEQKVQQLKQIQRKHQKLLDELKLDQVKLTFKLSQKQKQILVDKVKKHVQANLKDLYTRYFQTLASQVSNQGGFQGSTKIMIQITKIIQANPQLAKKMNVQIKLPPANSAPPPPPPPPPASNRSTNSVPSSPVDSRPLPSASVKTHPLAGNNSQQTEKLKKNLLIQRKTSAILFQILMNLISKIKQCFKKMNQTTKRWQDNANKAPNEADKNKCIGIAKVFGILTTQFEKMIRIPDTIAGKYAAQDLHNQVKSHYDAIMSMSLDSFNMTSYMNSFGQS